MLGRTSFERCWRPPAGGGPGERWRRLWQPWARSKWAEAAELMTGVHRLGGVASRDRGGVAPPAARVGGCRKYAWRTSFAEEVDPHGGWANAAVDTNRLKRLSRSPSVRQPQGDPCGTAASSRALAPELSGPTAREPPSYGRRGGNRRFAFNAQRRQVAEALVPMALATGAFRGEATPQKPDRRAKRRWLRRSASQRPSPLAGLV